MPSVSEEQEPCSISYDVVQKANLTMWHCLLCWKWQDVLISGRKTENGSEQKKQWAAEKGKREICGHKEDAGPGATGFSHKQTSWLIKVVTLPPLTSLCLFIA